MAWIRALVPVAAVALLASCGGASPAKTGNALTKDGSFEGGGWALSSSGPTGARIRFVEDSLVGIGITFHNTSRVPVTVVGADLVPPPGSIVHQVGTRLLSWNPRPCPPHVLGCLASFFFRQPSAAARPRPVAVKPGKGLGVQLDFRLGRCSDVPLASFAPVESLDVAYRVGSALRQQAFALGGATLLPTRPSSGACRPRPFSRLVVDGTFAGSTASTIPVRGTCTRTSIGSFLCDDADRCSRADGNVTFRSGLFESGDAPAQRIEIRLRGFRGVARYVVGRGADVTAVVGIGEHGWTDYQAFAGSVTVDRVTPGTIEGHVHATLTGFRKRPFHASGTWACTVAG